MRNTFAPSVAVLAEHRAHLRDWLARTADPFGETHYAFPGQRAPTPDTPWLGSPS